ncbi:hypothetical protein M8818_003405 [Zalaria obscura]|uniref:Uncharacterized protein n=1 Tax=Zalaria obscura TaxID=2024903 RepID=A0ACC3SFX2_9PEZI
MDQSGKLSASAAAQPLSGSPSLAFAVAHIYSAASLRRANTSSPASSRQTGRMTYLPIPALWSAKFPLRDKEPWLVRPKGLSTRPPNLENPLPSPHLPLGLCSPLL